MASVSALADVRCQESGMTMSLHPWGHFKPGAWKLYQVVTETYDEHGTVVNKNITYRRTTLKSADERNSVALLSETVVEVAGKRLDTEPRTVKESLYGDAPDENQTVKKLDPAEVVVDGRKIACQVEQLESTGARGKTVTKTWYSTQMPPYVFRRETKTADAEGKATLSETVLEVTSLHTPCELLPHITTAARVLVVSNHPSGKTVTNAVTSTEIPGGVVCHTADEFDRDGRLLRRSRLSLIEYSSEPRRERSGLFYRIRSHRAHRLPMPEE